MPKIVGKCPFCLKDLTIKDLDKGKTEFGVWTETKVFKCIYCNRIISITHNKFSK